jgi:DNA transformation protein
MAVSREFLEFIKDQMSGFGPVNIRRMFGGAGISLGGVTFAIVVDEVLYLKEDAFNTRDFEAEKLERFSYESKDSRRIEMSYRCAPARLLDDADEMVLWCRKAYEAALRGRRARHTTQRSRHGRA